MSKSFGTPTTHSNRGVCSAPADGRQITTGGRRNPPSPDECALTASRDIASMSKALLPSGAGRRAARGPTGTRDPGVGGGACERGSGGTSLEGD